jgi:hypothetical protein
MVQVDPAAIDPPESATLPLAATAVTEPPQLVAAPGVAATTTPDGNVSVSATLVRATALVAVFATVIVNVDVPFTGIVAAEKAFVIVTGGTTISVPVATEPFVAPSFVVTFDAGMVLT